MSIAPKFFLAPMNALATLPAAAAPFAATQVIIPPLPAAVYNDTGARTAFIPSTGPGAVVALPPNPRFRAVIGRGNPIPANDYAAAAEMMSRGCKRGAAAARTGSAAPAGAASGSAQAAGGGETKGPPQYSMSRDNVGNDGIVTITRNWGQPEAFNIGFDDHGDLAFELGQWENADRLTFLPYPGEERNWRVRLGIHGSVEAVTKGEMRMLIGDTTVLVSQDEAGNAVIRMPARFKLDEADGVRAIRALNTLGIVHVTIGNKGEVTVKEGPSPAGSGAFTLRWEGAGERWYVEEPGAARTWRLLNTIDTFNFGVRAMRLENTDGERLRIIPMPALTGDPPVLHPAGNEVALVMDGRKEGLYWNPKERMWYCSATKQPDWFLGLGRFFHPTIRVATVLPNGRIATDGVVTHTWQPGDRVDEVTVRDGKYVFRVDL